MRTFEITQYKISNNSGLKLNQIPKDGTSREFLALKSSNSKMHSLTDLGNGSQMDFQSVNRQWLTDDIFIYLTFINSKKLSTN